jgi:hypothetical protein
MAGYAVIDVVAMGDRFVSAVGAVHLGLYVPRTLMCRRAHDRVAYIDCNFTFVNVIFMGVMQVPVVEVIDMVAVLERRVTAIRTVNVRVGVVCGVSHRCAAACRRC